MSRSEGSFVPQVDKRPEHTGMVSRAIKYSLSGENFVGMGSGFIARAALKQIVGGPIVAPVIGTVSAVASGIAREAHRADKIDNFSDYLRYQRGEITYEKLMKEHEERARSRNATPIPKRIFEWVKSTATDALKATAQKVEDVTGIGKAVSAATTEIKTRIIHTKGYTDISNRLETLKHGVVATATKIIQSEAGGTVIRTLKQVDTKLKDVATGQSQRLSRLDKIDRPEGAQNEGLLWRGTIQHISNEIRTRRSNGETVDANIVRQLFGENLDDKEVEKNITQLEKIATDAFIAHAVAANGQKRGERDIQSDTFALAKDAMRIVKAYKGEGFESIHNSTRKRIAREAKGVVGRSVVVAGLKRAALAPITSYIGSEVSAALKPYTDPILQPILRPVQEAVATEINRAASSASHIVAPIVSMISHVTSEPQLPLSHIPNVIETDITSSTPRTEDAALYTGSGKLASPVRIGQVSSEEAVQPKVSMKLKIAPGASLSGSLQNAGLLSKDFSQSGSAQEFYDRVIAPNASRFNGTEYAQLTAGLKNADTMAQYYQNNKQLFQNSWMEKLSTADEVNIALKTTEPHSVVYEPPPPKEITVPPGGTVFGELYEQGIFTKTELSNPGSASEFYKRFIVPNQQIGSVNAAKALSFMQDSKESFYALAAKRPEIYKVLNAVHANSKFTVLPPAQSTADIPITRPGIPQEVLPDSSQSSNINLSKSQADVGWHFVTDGNAGVMHAKMADGSIRDVVLAPIGSPPETGAPFNRFELLSSVQSLLGYSEKDLNYLLQSLDSDMNTRFPGHSFTDLLTKALLIDVYQHDKALPSVPYNKGYIKDLFEEILAKRDLATLEKIDAYSLDQALARARMSTSKSLLPEYDQTIRRLMSGVKSQSDLVNKIVQDPSIIGMKIENNQVSTKGLDDNLTELMQRQRVTYASGTVDTHLRPVVHDQSPSQAQPEKIVAAAIEPIHPPITVSEPPPTIPRNVTIEQGESLLSALNRVDAFTDSEMKLLNNPGGGKIFFDRIIKPNIGKGLIFTEDEGKTLQKLFDNPNATLYGVMYDPKLTRNLTKLMRLLAGQNWTIKPSAEQLHLLELYEQRVTEAKAFQELVSMNRATRLRILNDESAPAPEFTTDKGPLPIKLSEVPFTQNIFQAYLAGDGHIPLGLAETQSVLKALVREGLTPADVDLVREVGRLKGITGVDTELAALMSDPRVQDHQITQALRLFIDAHRLATDIATKSPYGLRLLSQMGYENMFMHRQMLAVEGFDSEAFEPRPGIQKFGESLFVVGGINGDAKQEFVARLATPFLQRPNSFEYRAMQALEKITSLPAQTLSTLQNNRFYIPFMCESVTPDEKHILLSKLIADAKLFGVYQESEVIKIYNDASSGDVDAYHQIEKILMKPGESARYLRAFKPSADGNVLYQILRPDQNPDLGHVMGKVKDYGRYLGLVEYGEKTIPSVAKIGKISSSTPLIGDELFTLPHKPELVMPTSLNKSVPIDSLFRSRYTDNIFVETPAGNVSRLTGALQESLTMQSYPRGFIDILTTVENTQQTGDEFLKRVIGRNILTGGLQKIDEVLGSNLAGDRVLGGGSTADMQLTEMLLGDPYTSSVTSLHGRRPDLYGRLDYLNYLMLKIRSPGTAVLPYESALSNMTPVSGNGTDAIYQPNPSFETRDLRALANKDALAKVTAKFETFLLARELQNTYSHDEVIAAYLNHVPMGAAGMLEGGQGREILGFQAASRVYFGRPIDQLSPAEQLVLVKIANAPMARSPLISPDPNSLHPALNSAIMDIESKFIPAAKSEAEKQFWSKQIEIVRNMKFANTVPDEWKLETPHNLPPGTYSRFQSLLDGKLAHRDVAEIPGVGYVMQLEQPAVAPPPRTFGGAPLPQDFVEYKPPAPLNSLIGQRFTPTKAGYEILTDKGQRITAPTFTQAYQDESGKWVTTKTIGVGVVAVDADTLEPVMNYDPSRSILGYAPPASTIKPFVASFLQSKGVDINTVRFPNIPGQYALDGSKLMVNNHSEYLDRVSQMTLAQALLDSTNVPFQYAMKEYLSQHPEGWAEFQDFMRHFGIPLRNVGGVILDKPSAYSAIGTDVVVNMEDYARAYALLANPERVFNDPNITKSIKIITDHMTSDTAIKYLSADNPYPITAPTMNGDKVVYFTKSGTEGPNSLLNAGFIKSADGKTVSIVTRVVNQNILFNAAGQPHATAGNLVQVLGANQAWGSRTAAPISYLAAESIEKAYMRPELITVTPSPVITHTPVPSSLSLQQPTATATATPEPPATSGIGSSSVEMPRPVIATQTPVIMYGGQLSNWSAVNPIATATPAVFTSQAVGMDKNVNDAAAEIVTSLSKLKPGEKPILIGHSFGANVVMTAAYGQIINPYNKPKVIDGIAGLILEDPTPVGANFWDSLENLGKISDKDTPVLLILSQGQTIPQTFLDQHPKITVNYFPKLTHLQLPADAGVQSVISAWTANLNK